MSATSPSPSTPVKRPLHDIPFYFASPPPSSPIVDALHTSSSSSYPVTPLPHPQHLWSAHPSTPSPVPRRLLELTPDPTAIFTTPERGQNDESSSPSLSGSLHNSGRLASGKRGRPRADLINHLIVEGSSSPSEIKCKVCNRVFPREKSLQAHMRTHTGEKPYICNYPNCTRAFTQSGQLKTHQRLHAGEKPFVCSASGCTNRYTHANRTCPLHPYDKPKRTSEVVLQPSLSAAEDTQEVRQWLENYRRERMDKTPGKNNASTGEVLLAENNQEEAVMPMPKFEHMDSFNSDHATPTKKPKSKRGLTSELEQENVPSSLLQQQQQIQPPYPHHVSPRRLAGFPARPLEPQRLLLNSSASPLRPRSPPCSSSSPRQPSLGFPVIRSPLRSSPLRRCLLPSSSPVRPSGSDSPARRSLLEERLVMSSPVARRVTLDGLENEQSSRGCESPPSCKKSPHSSPIRRRVPLSPRFPKKRWLKKCYRQHRETTAATTTTTKDSDELAEPIRWNGEALAPAPKSLIVAAAALVELKGERSRQQWQWQHSDTSVTGHDSNQPLNLSISATTVKSD